MNLFLAWLVKVLLLGNCIGFVTCLLWILRGSEDQQLTAWILGLLNWFSAYLLLDLQWRMRGR